jgi:pimeloyl-ACP methyl ester carboxylesterase
MQAAPVVLVHGFASSFHRNWREPGWVDLLEEGGRAVIGIDLLGHGDAPKPHDPEAYGDLEAGVEAALPPDGAQVDGLGFSLGARVLLTLASRIPERFGHIVVGGVGENLFREDTTDAVARAMEGGPLPDHPEAQAFARFAQGSGNDPAALAAVLRRPTPPLTTEMLSRVTCPVLVVLGDRDFAGPADPLVDALPNATLKVLKGVDHLATPTDFGFIDATLEFLDALP